MSKQKKKVSLWDSPITRAIMDLAYEGFTHRTIGRATGCGIGCVSYRLKKLGIKTANVRNGQGEVSADKITRILNRRGLKGLGPWGSRKGRAA